MKTKDRLDEIEAQLDHITNRIDNLRDEFIYHIEKENKHKEPLIKDEKIRQCVKLWAYINEFKGKIMYSNFDDYCSFYEINSQEELLFLGQKCLELKHAVQYTIDELCGEEEDERNN